MSKYNLKKNCCVVPKFIHIEVTQKCPLNCRQCYCSLDNKNELEWEKAEKIVKEAATIGVEQVLATGGEPLLYPYLIDLIKLIKKMNMKSVISTSGCGLSNELLMQLKSSEVDNVFVSLNGSNKEVNELSRGKFDEAIKAIKKLREMDIWCGINWVARKDNINDFPSLIELAKKLNVNQVAILSHKNGGEDPNQTLCEDEIERLANYIREYRRQNFVSIDLCYPELNYYLLGERMHPLLKNCIAGRYFMDVLVDGMFSPCRHIGLLEKYDNLQEYWNNSNCLKIIREGDNSCEKKCRVTK